MNTIKTDVVIMGGGLAGLSLALQTKGRIPKAKITVLEKRSLPVAEATHKVGESTVEVAAYYFSQVLGLKDHIESEQLPKLGLRFFFPHQGNSAIENRLELGGRRYAPAPSYQLDRGRFENYLAQTCRERGIEVLDQAEVKQIELKRWGNSHQVSYLKNKHQSQINARWVVDASGRRALLKRTLNLGMPSKHRCNAAWFRIGKRICVDDWCQNEEWTGEFQGRQSRWYSTNHLMGEGYWVWLIPLSSGSTSVGIVAAEEFHPLSSINSLSKALDWLKRHEPQCAAQILCDQDQIQDFLAIRDYALECKQVFSASRWGIVGEAGFFHDPFYSPGSDFIAFANTFLSDLIERDLSGNRFQIRAFAYDKIFKKFYYGTATAYYDQYQLFGNPQVMPIKILWDYLIYWSITCFIYMHDRLCQQAMYMRHVNKLNRLGELNHCMQEVFRKWHQRDGVTERTGMIDISSIPLIRQKNEELMNTLDRAGFARQFAINVQQMETLFWEILDESKVSITPRFKRRVYPDTIQNGFESVFQITHQKSDLIPAFSSINGSHSGLNEPVISATHQQE